MFAGLGIFSIEGFVTAAECQGLIRFLRETEPTDAGIVRGGKVIVDRESRRTGRVTRVDEVIGPLDAKFGAVLPELERTFGVTLSGWQPPDLLVYREGDYFRPHVDSYEAEENPEFLTQRTISAVIFLGHENRAEEDAGGALIFYDLFEEPRLNGRGIAFQAEPGMLVAFRATVVHEVTTVRSGQRYSVATWFYQ